MTSISVPGGQSKSRFYSVINQLLIWLTIALVFGGLLERFLKGPRRKPAADEALEPSPVPVGSGQA